MDKAEIWANTYWIKSNKKIREMDEQDLHRTKHIYEVLNE